MEKSKVRLKGYIDQLLAAVLDRDPNLLEGLPRLQQNTGMRPDLLRVASLPEVVLPNYIILYHATVYYIYLFCSYWKNYKRRRKTCTVYKDMLPYYYRGYQIIHQNY